MLIIEKPLKLRKIVKQWSQEKQRIALVPTMGNLHKGHMRLIDRGRALSDKVIVSIFVNPMQFENQEDLENYPRTLEEDYKKLSNRGIDAVFTPDTTAIYPGTLTNQTYVDVPSFNNILEGKSRPGHFRGVATIICKLFNLVQPDLACFGEKDFQQLMLIRQLVHDMNYDIEIVSVPTVRSYDGLALSSRNKHLSDKERCQAPKLYQVLMQVTVELQERKYHIDELLNKAKRELLEAGWKPDTLVVQDAETLGELTKNTRRAVVLFSAWLGKTRLIDNAHVDLIL
ncbi:pantoate--beta-alanine ligase [secondary endosymbiont of Heteropsylla cubana]|uniref:Pantothenate synthetase n=1 Tax=secondary endosymbiont of Heteropsylla cubana TaxID=134287 RepID=J3TGM5_9ENTR|nr:pantoate--beta-alanine ligase [secondary endosymbiont of Heteropsylla cubana]AFP85622.1 pantoate--beta-alanine ligase [secondary endosymbiont of Heteropsylla cubana]